MTRFCYCFLIFYSIFLTPWPRPAFGNQAVSAEYFLKSLEPSPNSADLYDFFEIYNSSFTSCRELSPYIRGLSYLADNGDIGVVSKRLDSISKCPNITLAEQRQLNKLQAKVKPEPIIMKENKQNKTSSAEPGLNPKKIAELGPNPKKIAEPGPSPKKIAEPGPSPKKIAEPGPSPKKITELGPSPKKITEPGPSPVKKTNIIEKSKTIETITPPLIGPVKKIPAITGRSTLARIQTPPPIKNPLTDASRHISVGTANAWRSGDRGTSRLFTSENTLRAAHGPWSIASSVIYLNSGRYNDLPQTGSAFITNPKYSLLTEATVFTPQINYTGDNFSILLGSTPLGGEVSPLPTGKITWRNGNASIAIFQEPIADSLLSYVGFNDIYTGEKMGRVVKAGGKINWNDTFASSWFYGASLTGAHLYGKNVENNNALKAEAYIGKNFGNISAGFYSSFERFTRDLNHFTFGHGGYYSPQAASVNVMFLSYNYSVENITFKADVSAGYAYEKTDDIEIYLKNITDKSIYAGEAKHKFTINTGFDTRINLYSGFSLNTNAHIINSGDFTEGKVGINLKYEF